MVIVGEDLLLIAQCPDCLRVVVCCALSPVKPRLMLILARVKLSACALVVTPKYCQSTLIARIGVCVVEWLCKSMNPTARSS